MVIGSKKIGSCCYSIDLPFCSGCRVNDESKEKTVQRLKPMRILQGGMGKIVLICRFIICWALFEVKGYSSRWMKCADTTYYRNGLASKLHTVSAI